MTRSKKKLTEAEKRQNKINRFHQDFLALTIDKVFNRKGTGVASLFQRLVRLQAADEYGMCVCISCGARKKWNELDSGHFESRANKKWILSPDNCFPQCVFCNQHQGGAKSEYRKSLVMRIGEKRVVEIETTRLPKNHVWDRYELAEIKVDLLEMIKMHEKRLGV